MIGLEFDIARQKLLVGHTFLRGTSQHLHYIFIGVDAAHLATLDDAVDFACAFGTLAILNEKIILPSQSVTTHASLRDVVAQFEETIVAESIKTVYALKCIVESSPNIAFLRRLEGVKRPVHPFSEPVKIEPKINRSLPCHFVGLELSFPANPFKKEHPVDIIERLIGHILVIFKTIPKLPSNMGHAEHLHQMLLRPFRHFLVDFVPVILYEPASVFLYLLVKHAGTSGPVVGFEVHEFELWRDESPVIPVSRLVLVSIDDELDRFIHIDAVAGEHLLPDGLVKSFECVNAIFGIVVESALCYFEPVGKHVELPLKRNVVAIFVDENACDEGWVAPALPQLFRNPRKPWGDDHAVLAVYPTLVDHLVKSPWFVEDAPVLLGFHQACAFEQAGVGFENNHVFIFHFHVGVISLAGTVLPHTLFPGFGCAAVIPPLSGIVRRGAFICSVVAGLSSLLPLPVGDSISASFLSTMFFFAACTKQHAFEFRDFFCHLADGPFMVPGFPSGKFELLLKAVHFPLVLLVLFHENPDELHVSFMLLLETFYGFHQLVESFPVVFHFRVQRYGKRTKPPNFEIT